MKKFKFISVLSALVLGLFIGCEQPSQNKQISITWSSPYDCEKVPKTKYVDKGYKLTEEDLPDLFVANRKFNGWMNNGSKANVGDEINDHTILNAEWELNKYTITFITKIGTAPDSVSLEYGANYLLDSKKLSQKGYNFLGWSFTENGSIIEDTSITIDKDITLYAVWEKIQKRLNTAWTIDYNSNPEKFSRTDKIPYSDKSKYEKITLQLEKYTGAFSDSWEFEASENPYTVYINGNEIIISANATDPDEKIVFDENCNSLFSTFSNVQEIVFPEKIDTSKVTDMSYMFLGCNSLSSLDLSYFNTSNVTDMFCMFSQCESITTLDLSHFNTSKVTDMKQMFNNCEGLTDLNVSNFDTSKVTNMSYMFSNCKRLTDLNVSNFDTSKVTNMSYMFSNCEGLTDLNVSNFDTSKVTNMKQMFYTCTSIQTLTFGNNFNTSNVTDMSYIFSNCKGLTTLNVSNFDTSKVTDMSYMFNNCKNINLLDLSSFDTANVTIMNQMFYNCINLQCIFASDKFKITKVTEGNNVFTNDNKLVGYDTNPASGGNQHRHEFYNYQNDYHYAVIYKTGDGTPFSSQIGFFTDVAIKNEVLEYLAIQPAE